MVDKAIGAGTGFFYEYFGFAPSVLLHEFYKFIHLFIHSSSHSFIIRKSFIETIQY